MKAAILLSAALLLFVCGARAGIEVRYQLTAAHKEARNASKAMLYDGAARKHADPSAYEYAQYAINESDAPPPAHIVSQAASFADAAR